MKGFKAGHNLVFIIDNINGFTKLYKDGFKPVYKPEGSESWKVIPSEAIVDQDTTSYLKFEHVFENSEMHYFAFCEPFS